MQQMQVWVNMKELFNKTRNNILSVQSESKCSLIQADSAKLFCIHDPICCISLSGFTKIQTSWILGSNKAFLTDTNISEGICCSKRDGFPISLKQPKTSKGRRLKIRISWKPKRNEWQSVHLRSEGAIPRQLLSLFVVPAEWIYLPASPPQTGCAPRGCLQSKRGTAPPSAGAGPTAWSWHRGGDTQLWPMERKNLRSSYWNWRKNTNRQRRERRRNQMIQNSNHSYSCGL